VDRWKVWEDGVTFEFQNLKKTFRKASTTAVNGVSLRLPPNTFTVILGPSGCGKTTLLRLLAGLVQPDEGTVSLNGQDTTRIAPEKRRIGLVFQEDSLFPGMTLRRQIEWARESCPSGFSLSADQLLVLGGMQELADRFPHQLSGGERQRGAILRSLAASPVVLLLDEPFSRLDAPLRDSLRRDVKKLLKETQTSAVLVTHDQEEAFSLADHLVVMDGGKIIQQGKPEEVYSFPNTAFAASFLGRANIFQAEGHGREANLFWGEVPLAQEAEGPVTVMLRPEHLSLKKDGPFLVKSREFRGHDVTWRLEYEGQEILVHTDWNADFKEGEKVGLEVRKPAVVLESPLSPGVQIFPKIAV